MSEIRLVVLDVHGQSVFDNMHGIFCATLVRTHAYTPQETKELKLTWNQTSMPGGGQLPAGKYTANARDRSLECGGELDRARNFSIR